MHTGTSSIHGLIASCAGALLPVIAITCCTPNPRFTSTHYRPPSALPAGAPAEVSPPQSLPADTVAAAPQPEMPLKTTSAQGRGEPLASDTAPLASSWTSAFDEKGEKEASSTVLESGLAVWYGPGFQGKKTASGERFDMNECTAAHRMLHFNTTVKVTNLKNGLSVVVRINDRGPFDKKYCIDLSLAAARKIELDKSGTAEVRLEAAREP